MKSRCNADTAAHAAPAGNGFTLLELLVGIAIFVLVASVTFSMMAAVSKAWQRGTALCDNLDAGDYVLDQIIEGLQATRYRDKGDGFQLKDNGDGPGSADSISWVKEGSSLVGEDSNLARIYHRIRFFVGRDKQGKRGACFTAWGDEYMQPDDFDPEALTPEMLSDRVVGFNCRVATNDFERSELHWLDTWEETLGGGDSQTNHVPRFVEITLYLKPLTEGDPPVEMRRMADIPVANQGMK